MLTKFVWHVAANKHIITCHKNFYATQKKCFHFSCITNFFLFNFYVQFFTFNFYIAHWQHADLFCNSPENKETFNPSFTHLPSFTLWRALCNASVKGSYFSKVAEFFPQTFETSYTVTSIFQGFYQYFKQFFIVSNIFRRLSNVRFRKF